MLRAEDAASMKLLGKELLKLRGDERSVKRQGSLKTQTQRQTSSISGSTAKSRVLA